MARPKTRMITAPRGGKPFEAYSSPAKCGKDTLTDAYQLQRYVTHNKGNPFAYLCRVISGRTITCSHYDEETGEYRDVKVRASIAQRTEAARILAAKMLPDLKALDVTATQQVTVDIARINTAQLFSYLSQAGIPLPADYSEVLGDSDIQPIDGVESNTPPSLSPAQTKPALDPSPMPLIPLAEAALLVPTSDLPAGLDKPDHLACQNLPISQKA